MPRYPRSRCAWLIRWGKMLVDANNALVPSLSDLLLGTNTLRAEELAKMARGAHVAEVFNITGRENMANTRYLGGTPMMPVCGNDPDARRRVAMLVNFIGMDAVGMGRLGRRAL